MHRIALTLVFILGLTAPAVRASSSAPAGPPQSSTSDAVSIYRRCVAAMAAVPDPPYAFYVLAINANRLDLTRSYAQDGTPTMTLHYMAPSHANTYRVWYRYRDRRSLMQDVTSAERTVSPPVPWALNFQTPESKAPARTAGSDVGSSAVELDQATELASEIDTDQSAHYVIALAGLTEHQGHPAYDLRLSSINGDPNDHPLRELIVDRRTFRVWQLAVEVGKHDGLVIGSLRLIATFRPVGRYWLNDAGTLSGEGRIAFMHFRGSYDYSASRFRFPHDMPDSYFEAQGPRAAVHR